MPDYLTSGAMALLAIVALAVAMLLLRRRRQARRMDSVRHLLDLADRMEADLKTCRTRLAQAHAVISLNPDTPAAREQDARGAVDNGLRALLRQRLWIRDHAPRASQRELDDAVAAMTADRDRLHPLLAELDRAQHDLDSAMRQRIPREPSA